MKKTLFVTLDYPPQLGGVARYYSNIIRRLPAADITVLATPQKNYLDFDQRQAYKILRKNFYLNIPLFWPKWLRLVFELFQIVQERKIKALLIGQVLPVGSAAYLVNHFKKIPYILFTHGLDIMLPQQSNRKKNMLRRVLDNASYVVTNSEFTKNELSKFNVTSQKLITLTPGCDIIGNRVNEKRYRELFNKHKLAGSKILLTVGRLEERKGHDLVLKSMAAIKDKYSDLKYIIVGEGKYRNRLKELAQELKLRERIIFTGAVPEQDLPVYYQLADIFIMPSRELSNRDVEGFGIVYLEANAMAKPVIGGRSGGVTEAIIDGQTGLIINPESIIEISAAIERLITNKSYAESLGLAGQQRVLKDFRWSNRAKKIEELINRL